MKLFVGKDEAFQINENAKLLLLNVNEFIATIKRESKCVPARHIRVSLKYKLICNSLEYEGESIFDSYKCISNNIDENSPYKVELINWNLSDNEENYLEFNFVKNAKEASNNDESAFTSYVGMECEEIKQLINNKIELLSDKLSGNVDENEKANPGYLFWNCKMILRNIYMSCDKLVDKFSESLTQTETDNYQYISKLLKNDESNWKSIESIEDIFAKVRGEYKFKNFNLKIGLICPNCEQKLTFSMPDGTHLFCNNCNKCYMNNNGTVGEETTSPYIDNNVLY